MSNISNVFNAPEEGLPSLDVNGHDRDWIEDLPVKTRSDVIKILTILARGLDRRLIKKDGVLIGVLADQSWSDLVPNTICFDLDDRKNPFTEPLTSGMYLESKPNEATCNKVRGIIPVDGQDFGVAFERHPSFLCAGRAINMRQPGLFPFSATLLGMSGPHSKLPVLLTVIL